MPSNFSMNKNLNLKYNAINPKPYTQKKCILVDEFFLIIRAACLVPYTIYHEVTT